jgi:site-specific DNA-methyltransferase (adenine-specific)
MNRRYIGIEISEQYHYLAEQRHIELENGLDPFAKRDIIPQAKNSRVNRIKKQKYDVSKKTLQLEVRDIALKIGRKPTREDIEKYSQYPFRYFNEYFADWGEVCSAVGDKGMQENKDIDNYPNFKQLELPFE